MSSSDDNNIDFASRNALGLGDAPVFATPTLPDSNAQHQQRDSGLRHWNEPINCPPPSPTSLAARTTGTTTLNDPLYASALTAIGPKWTLHYWQALLKPRTKVGNWNEPITYPPSSPTLLAARTAGTTTLNDPLYASALTAIGPKWKLHDWQALLKPGTKVGETSTWSSSLRAVVSTSCLNLLFAFTPVLRVLHFAVHKSTVIGVTAFLALSLRVKHLIRASPAPRSASVADIADRITWISPTPVKVTGHFCDVYEGRDSNQGKLALKTPRIGAIGDNEDVRRFHREAETWGALQHPHILEFLGTFQRDGRFYCVSPFIENGSLLEYIALHPSVNRVRLLCETADAITYLHQQDVVHGDIKASNLLISDNGQVLLCDFGLTRTTDSRTSMAMKGAGTLRWQCPDLWNGSSKSFKSDVYAFSMTIVEVLTGDVPFPDLETEGAVIRAVLIEGRRPPKVPIASSAGLSYKNVWAVAEACWPAASKERISMREAWQLIQEDPASADI